MVLTTCGDDHTFTMTCDENRVPDPEKFVEIMDSRRPVTVKERVHAWAENPQTIGCLAIAQLGLKCMNIDGPDSYINVLKDRIRTTGGIKKMAGYINPTNNETQDRVENAVVALSFICADNDENCIHLYECDGLRGLINIMRDGTQKEGCRITAAVLVRNMLDEGDMYTKTFIELKGPEGYYYYYYDYCAAWQIQRVLSDVMAVVLVSFLF